MKRWHIILIAVVALWLITGLLHIIPPVVNPFDNPRYALGEATAMVERVHKKDLSGLSVTEKYLGRGAWEVRVRVKTEPSWLTGWKEEWTETILVFRVYETSGTVDVYKAYEIVHPAPLTPAYIWAIIATTPAYIWAIIATTPAYIRVIIAIGALAVILLIAVIVEIVKEARTRRVS